VVETTRISPMISERNLQMKRRFTEEQISGIMREVNQTGAGLAISK
jgi:hypothetical protein